MIGMKKTIDNVLSTFNTMIEDLKKIEQAEKRKQIDFEIAQAVAYNNANTAREEAERAASVRQRIEQIVGE